MPAVAVNEVFSIASQAPMDVLVDENGIVPRREHAEKLPHVNASEV
jgi:hypothetical protein